MDKKLKSLHETIFSLIKEEVETNNVSYNKTEPYQSYERIQFYGLRWSVEKRIKEYGLSRFFNPKANVLDIGSNFGFFVSEFALHCNLVHGVEPNPHLIKIGEATSSYLGTSEKTNFFDTPFNTFSPPNSYDVILSLAAFFTQDGRERSDAEEYFSKINRLLAPGGSLFYESTSYKKEKSNPGFIAQSNAMYSIKNNFDSFKTWETTSGSRGYFRRFAVGKKIF